MLGLRLHTTDVGWQAVIVTAPGGQAAVRLGWVHPEIVEAVPTPPDMVTVGHTGWRGRNGPSHSIGWGPLGTRSHDTTLVLDARWEGRDARPTHECSGHCFEVAKCTIEDPYRMFHILEFAKARRPGLVCCEHAKHRSVAAARILELCFLRHVDYRHAAREWCHECCRDPVRSRVVSLDILLRKHQQWEGPTGMLSTMLGLRSVKSF